MKKLFFAIFSSRRSAGPEFTAQSRIGFTFMAPLPASRQITNEPIIAPHPISAPGRTREGFGGEKAAGKAASLPVPTTHRTPHRPSIAVQQSLRSASGSLSPCRPTAAESDSDPYAAPAPCRTPGVRGAADTPPAAHEPAAVKAHGSATRKAAFTLIELLVVTAC